MKKIYFILFFFLFASRAMAVDPITGSSAVCVGASITLASTTPGGVWSTGSGSIATISPSSGVLTGVAAGTVTVTYTEGSSFVVADVTVNPLPVLSSTLTPPAICDSAFFVYTPASSTPGAVFGWSRPFVPGIGALPVTGTGGINEILDNNTNAAIAVTYAITVSAGGCSSVQHVTVTVMPTPILSNAIPMPNACNGQPFVFFPMSFTMGVGFAWSRAFVGGVSPVSSAGIGSISETLMLGGTTPIAVTYVYTLTVGACAYERPLTVMVNPVINSGTISGSDTVCEGMSATFLSSMSGGTWSSTTGNASVTAGVVTGVISGADTINYALNGVCATTAREPVTVLSAADCDVAVRDVHAPAAELRIYPNPARGSVRLSVISPDRLPVRIRLTNIMGQVMSEQDAVTNKEATVRLPDGAGMYLATVIVGDKVLRSGVVVCED